MLVITALFASGFFFGWAKPTPVNPMNLQRRPARRGARGAGRVRFQPGHGGHRRDPRCGSSLGTPESCGIASRDPRHAGPSTSCRYYFVADQRLRCSIFNLLPMPPLDGWRVLIGLVNAADGLAAAPVRAAVRAIIPLVFLALILFGGARHPCRDHGLLGPELSCWASERGGVVGGKVAPVRALPHRRGCRSPSAQRLTTWLTPGPAGPVRPDAPRRPASRPGRGRRAPGRGHDDPDLLLAGLLHDCGQGPRLQVWHRVSVVAGRALRRWVDGSLGGCPASGGAFDRCAHHARADPPCWRSRAGCQRRRRPS